VNPNVKKGNESSADDDLTSTDGESGGSHYSEEKEEEDPSEQLDAKLTETIELLTDKKAASRLSALTALNTELGSQILKTFLLDNRLETVFEYLTSCVKKGDVNETSAACRSLALIALTVGFDAESMIESLSSSLTPVIKNQGKPTATRASAVLALGVLCFACTSAEEEKSTLASMALFSSMWQQARSSRIRMALEVGPELVAQCIESWGLLATTLPTSKRAGVVMEEHIPVLMSLLEHKSLDVRIAAGENIALLFDANNNCPKPDYGLEGKKGVVDKKELNNRLSALANDGERYKGRKERAIQRSKFRDIIQTVIEGEEPSESIKVGAQKYDLRGWVQMIQLATLRQVLQQGFLIHFTNNELLAQILELIVDPPSDDPIKNRMVRRRAIKESRIRRRAQQEHNEKQRRNKSAHLSEQEQEQEQHSFLF